MTVEETVFAQDSRGRWVWVTVEKDQPIRVKITAVKQEGRGFTRVNFRHATVGSTSLVFPSRSALKLAP